MGYCTICDMNFCNEYLHLDTYHKQSGDNITDGLNKYKIHFDKYCNDQTVMALRSKKLEREDPFWSAAKQNLNEEEYIKLREYANGEEKRFHRYKR